MASVGQGLILLWLMSAPCDAADVLLAEILQQVRHVEFRNPAVGDLFIWKSALPTDSKYLLNTSLTSILLGKVLTKVCGFKPG